MDDKKTRWMGKKLIVHVYVTVTISVESRRLETDIVTDTYRRSEF